ncbi:MAG: transketolase [Candidatus Omnitrophica bacterium]|nr:transketolase [Candidatus Omnitrophota bacterium]
MSDPPVQIRQIEKRCLSNLFDILELHGLGHTGGSLSILQMLISLYFQAARLDPGRPGWAERDRIILSKSHACEAMYAVLAERGYFSKERFKEYLSFGSDLQGHAEITTPGVEYSGGSLGQGISFACGVAYAAKLRRQGFRVYCLLGDGECHEGSVWEAAMFAAHYRLDNLFVLVDFNHYVDHGDVDELMNLQPFEEKWKAFGWETVTVEQGNDVQSITEALEGFRQPQKPKCLIGLTVKNYGVPSWAEKHLHQAAGETLRRGLQEGRALLNAG